MTMSDLKDALITLGFNTKEIDSKRPESLINIGNVYDFKIGLRLRELGADILLLLIPLIDLRYHSIVIRLLGTIVGYN